MAARPPAGTLAAPAPGAPVSLLLGYPLAVLLLASPAVEAPFFLPRLLATLALTLPAHELLHALCFPAGLRSPRTFLGFWSVRLLFYAAYQGAQPRRRYLLAGLAPFFVLTLLPLAALLALGLPSAELAALSLLNALCSSGDVLLLLVRAPQLPRGALVRNHGWALYWRI